jgi:hypothetical protein
VRIVVIDQAFPIARGGAVDPATAPHPGDNDQVYQFAEKLFKDKKFAQARVIFEEKRATSRSPHPFYAYFIACCYAREGDRAKAAAWLRTAIEDGWKDFAHLVADEDLASLQGYAAYESLKTAGRRELIFDSVRPGQAIEIDIPSPIALLAIGAYVDHLPWEGWAAILTPEEITARVHAPTECRPGSSVTIEVETDRANADALVYLIVKDARLLNADTPASRLAGGLKSLVDAAGKKLSLGRATNTLLSAIPQMTRPGGIIYPGTAPVPTMAMPRVASAKSGSALSLDKLLGMSPYVGGEAAPVGAPMEGAAQSEDSSKSQINIVDEPEVLFAGLVDVKDGRAKVDLQLGDAFADYVAEAFIISGLDWTAADARFRAEKELFISLDMPIYVHPEDTAIGKVYVGAGDNPIKVKVTRDGSAQPLIYNGKPWEDGNNLPIKRAELTFLVIPGDYEAIVEDTKTGRVDYSAKRVDVPGKLKRIARALSFLEPGQSLSRQSDPSITSLRVLPGLDKPFNLLINATADYGHACCEQTAAKMFAACAMYAFADAGSIKRSTAEAIIIAGVRREEQMWLRGQGFKMYPEMNNVPDNYYGPKAARYLWNLSLLRDISGSRLSDSLAVAIEKGLIMAEDATRAYKLDWPPKHITNCEEAFAVARYSDNENIRERAVTFVRNQIAAIDYNDGVGLLNAPSRSYLYGLVAQRAETAYAVATLLRAGSLSDRTTALTLANQVAKHFGAGGMLYSTVDSVATIALMAELRIAKIINSNGVVELNGKPIATAEAINSQDAIESILAVEGVTAVEVTRLVEEDWSALAAATRVSIALEKGGRIARQFVVGDAIDLKVKLEEGYKAGDLLWVCLPESLSRVIGGGQVKRFSIDFAGKNEVSVPLAATSVTVDREGNSSHQKFAVCVRNMFEEERAGNPGLLDVIVVPAGGAGGSIIGRALEAFKFLFNK